MIGIVKGEKVYIYGWPLTLLFLSINLGTIKLAPIMYGIYPSAYNISMRYMRTLCWSIYVLAIIIPGKWLSLLTEDELHAPSHNVLM